MPDPIDPRDFGRLEAQVSTLVAQVADLNGKVNALLDLANQGKGTLWAGRAMAGAFGGLLVWLADKVGSK